MHYGAKTVVVLLLCPAVTEALQQMHHFGHDFINSTVCFKKNKNKILNPEPSLALVLCFFTPALLQWVPGPFQLWSWSRPRRMEGGSVGSSSAAFPCTAFSTCQIWHTLGLICTCKAKQSSAFGVLYLSESRMIEKIQHLASANIKTEVFRGFCLSYSLLFCPGGFFFTLNHQP